MKKITAIVQGSIQNEVSEKREIKKQIDLAFDIILKALKKGLTEEDKRNLREIVPSLPKKKVKFELEAIERFNEPTELILHSWYGQ